MTGTRKLPMIVAVIAILAAGALALWPVETDEGPGFGCGSALVPDDDEAEREAAAVLADEERGDPYETTSGSIRNQLGDLVDEEIESAAAVDAEGDFVGACEDARSPWRVAAGVVLLAGLAAAGASWFLLRGRGKGATGLPQAA